MARYTWFRESKSGDIGGSYHDGDHGGEVQDDPLANKVS